MKILVLGTSGMLGYSLFKFFSRQENLDVHGTIRHKNKYIERFSNEEFKNILELDVLSDAVNIGSVINKIKPNYVINCIGSISQRGDDNINLIYLNSLLPHMLKKNCDSAGSKLIHFSTDCVFNGSRGNYSETDPSDASDLYGKTKYLGEILTGSHLTIRTSIIGHELSGNISLVDWFLNEERSVKGYKNVIFSGFPCIYVAKILNNFIFRKDICGLLHVAAQPISKYDLLSKIAQVYKKDIEIEEYEDYKSDKSLNSYKFNSLTGFFPPNWDELISLMHEEYCKNYKT